MDGAPLPAMPALASAAKPVPGRAPSPKAPFTAKSRGKGPGVRPPAGQAIGQPFGQQKKTVSLDAVAARAAEASKQAQPTTFELRGTLLFQT